MQSIIASTFASHPERAAYLDAVTGNPVLEIANPEDDTLTSITFSPSLSGVVREERLFRNGILVQSYESSNPCSGAPSLRAQVAATTEMLAIMRFTVRQEQQQWLKAA